MNDDDYEREPRWLERTMREAADEVATWPQWKQDAMRAHVKSTGGGYRPSH